MTNKAGSCDFIRKLKRITKTAMFQKQIAWNLLNIHLANAKSFPTSLYSQGLKLLVKIAKDVRISNTEPYNDKVISIQLTL